MTSPPSPTTATLAILAAAAAFLALFLKRPPPPPRFIYLDYLATTPLCWESSTKMLTLLGHSRSPEGAWGNPGSLQHLYGFLAREELDSAREKVRSLISAADVKEIVFESGSTETINHAIKGVLLGTERDHVVMSDVEHPAVEAVVRAAAKRWTAVGVNAQGLVDPQQVADAVIVGHTALVTIMLANNEVGAINDWKEIARLVRKKDPLVVLHVDASQGVGKISVSVQDLGVDLLTVAGHKLYAPKGIGALYVKSGTKLASFVHGAGHENGRRAGTENVLYASALGEACEAASKTDLINIENFRVLRERLFNRIQGGLSFIVRRNGPTEESRRLPGALSISFGTHAQGADVAAKAGKLGVAFSAGAACHSGQIVAPSKVLKATGMTDEEAFGTIRLSVGRYTTEEEIDRAADLIVQIVKGNEAVV